MTNPTFDSKAGKVEINMSQLHGILFWVTWEEAEIIYLRFRVAGESYEWQSHLRPLPTEAQNKDLIIQNLQDPTEHHRLSDTFTSWRNSNLEEVVIELLVLAISELVTENEVSDEKSL